MYACMHIILAMSILSNDCLSQGDSKHDTKIFSLSVLLSSTLVLNSQGTIDNRAIEELQYPSIPTLYMAVNGLDCYSEFPVHVWFGLGKMAEIVLLNL